MRYRNTRWTLRLFSLIAIGHTTFLELRWATTLYRQGLLLFIPAAIVVPALMIYIFFGFKVREPGLNEPLDEFDRSVRADLTKFAILTFTAAGLTLFQFR